MRCCCCGKLGRLVLLLAAVLASALVLAVAFLVTDDGVHARAGSSGPDVFVSDIFSTVRFGSDQGISAYALGTRSCNAGDVPISWQATSSAHPVKGQGLFRYEDGRFEMLGMSWLLHGFCALDVSGCGTCTPAPCDALGTGCATENSAPIQGSQAQLGGRFEVDASTGAFVFPPSSPPIQSLIDRRLQVRESEIDPALHPDAAYFVEAVQVAADDAAAGNGGNGASHREVTFSAAPNYGMSLVGATLGGEPAILAWAAIDPEVRLSRVSIDADGEVLVGSRCTPNGDGTWHYEYAVYNLSSHRSVGRFTIPLPEGLAIANPGFHDVDYHSGSPIDGTDWAPATSATSIEWSTAAFGDDPNANAIRWSTLYNFRFDAAAPPAVGLGTLGLFRPGTPDEVVFEGCIPSPFSIELRAASTEVPPGGDLEFDVTVTNLSSASGSTTAWIDVTKPNGQPYGGNPIVGPKAATLGAGRTLTRSIRLRIPARIPPSGPYTVTGRLGDFPAGASIESSFEFTVATP